MLKYEEGNLFGWESRHQTVLVHACNCRGEWGAGIATEFKRRYPWAYRMYQKDCGSRSRTLLGTSAIYSEDLRGPHIGCLFTSYDYGRRCDPPAAILKQTDLALEDFFATVAEKFPFTVRVYSPKFNSGLFGVNWDLTEALLKKHLEGNPMVDWTVCVLK